MYVYHCVKSNSNIRLQITNWSLQSVQPTGQANRSGQGPHRAGSPSVRHTDSNNMTTSSPINRSELLTQARGEGCGLQVRTTRAFIANSNFHHLREGVKPTGQANRSSQLLKPNTLIRQVDEV